VQQLLTDNGGAYISVVHALACRTLADQASADQAPSTPNQREGRALYSHNARRLGLRSDLPKQC
jgi:hypothetical protein